MSKSIFKINKTWTIFISLALVSIIANLISVYLGIAWGKGGYIEKLNWSLYPLFFVIIGLLVHSSWRLYIDAWSSLPINSVLYKSDVAEKEKSSLIPLVEKLDYIRVYLIFFSVLLGLVFTSIDAGCLWSEYGILSNGEKCEERDFSVAFDMLVEYPDVGKISNGLFNILVYILQGSLIASGFLVFFQISLNGIVFWKFEKTNLAINKSYSLRLNYKDPLCEFGLSEINRALNTVYVVIALAMVMPVLSAASQQTSEPDTGQLFLQILVPFLLLIPLIIPLIDRYFRLKETSYRVSISDNEGDAKLFKDQKLWPFEGTQVGYIGKAAAAIALAEYMYVLTGDIPKLVGSIKSLF